MIQPTDYKNNPWRYYVISEEKSPRLHQLISRHKQMVARDYGSWGRLLKTKGYKRRQAHADRLADHFHWYMSKKLPGLEEWQLHFTGSNLMIHVENRRRQSWLLLYKVVDNAEEHVVD